MRSYLYFVLHRVSSVSLSLALPDMNGITSDKHHVSIGYIHSFTVRRYHGLRCTFRISHTRLGAFACRSHWTLRGGAAFVSEDTIVSGARNSDSDARSIVAGSARCIRHSPGNELQAMIHAHGN